MCVLCVAAHRQDYSQIVDPGDTEVESEWYFYLHMISQIIVITFLVEASKSSHQHKLTSNPPLRVICELIAERLLVF